MKKGLSALLDKYGYNSVREASRKSLKTQGLPGKNMARFTFDASKCSGCARCVTVCPYNARVFSGGENAVDASLCRICGLCFTACPRQAIAIIEQP
jgi:ferredoxin